MRRDPGQPSACGNDDATDGRVVFAIKVRFSLPDTEYLATIPRDRAPRSPTALNTEHTRVTSHG